MNSPTISIIIPCYNAEKYIVATLDSMINNQNVNKDDFEIIVVNDGSIDSSENIVESYIKSNSKYNIRLYNKENGGSGDARNYGIEKAKGEYIWFFDADDLMEYNSLSYLIKRLNIEKLDILGIAHRAIFENYSVVEEKKVPINIIVDGLTYISQFEPNQSVCMIIIKRSILEFNHIRFLKYVMLEDFEFVIRLYNYCEKISHTDFLAYNYIIRQGSRSRRNDKKYFRFHHESSIKIVENLNVFISQNGSNNYNIVAKKYINVIKVSALAQLLKSPLSLQEKKEFWNQFKQVGIIKINYDGKFTKQRKIMYSLLKLKLYPLSLFLIELTRKELSND